MSFKLTDLEIHIGPSFYHTKNSFQIKRYWENNPGEIKSAERARMGQIAARYTLPSNVSIPAGGLKRGYAVFFCTST